MTSLPAVVFVLAVVPLLWCCTADAAGLNKVLLNDAVNEGAVCLDGSPPGYYFRAGERTDSVHLLSNTVLTHRNG